MLRVFKKQQKNFLFDKNFWFGTSLLTGTIVGVGLFGLPFVALQSSFSTMIIFFAIISVAIILLHHFYAEIGIHSGKPHHLPGHAGYYLGPWAKHLTLVSESIGLFGAQLAYLIVGGGFLARLFNQVETPATPFFVGIFFAIGAWLVWRGLKSVIETEFIMFALLVIMVVLFFIFSFFKATAAPHTIGLNSTFWQPYGVVIFSLWGLAVMPEIIALFPGEEKKISRVSLIGVLTAVVIYILFIWAVLSISGEHTTKESLAGLEILIPAGLFRFALLFGLLTTFTSFLAIGLALKRMFLEDYSLPHSTSWFLAMGVPLFLYLLGFDNFLRAIGISGSLGLTVSGVVIYLIYLKIKPGKAKVIHHKFFTHTSVIIALIALAVFGAFISLYYEFFGV